MNISPNLKVTRFAQLDPGDLCICDYDNKQHIALVICDPANNHDKLVLPLGPTFPDNLTGPTLLICRSATVISFGKEYSLRLPSQAKGWATNEPPPEKNCLLITEKGVYFRANFTRSQEAFRACYIHIETGLIHIPSPGAHEYSKPTGIPAYAIEWEILTTEEKPRTILAYPY